MNDINAILTAISTVGFPIVCAGAMWYTHVKTMKEMDETIERNTLAIQRLLDKLNGGIINE